MDFELTEDQETIRKAVRELAAKFDDQYWMEKDSAHEFPAEFYHAFADAGWLGITTPEEYGGARLRHHRGVAAAGGGRGLRRRHERRELRCTCRSSACTR